MINDKQKKPEIGIVKNQDILENQVKTVFLSIGSNLGNKIKNIELTKFKLISLNIKIIDSSSNYETHSWPDKNKPKFINVVLKVNTKLSPSKLLEECLKIEKELGRTRGIKNSPRTCDIDIIDYDQQILTKSKKVKISVPHPRMHERSFVLLPLYELTKSWIHPIKNKGIDELIRSLNVSDLRSIKLI